MEADMKTFLISSVMLIAIAATACNKSQQGKATREAVADDKTTSLPPQQRKAPRETVVDEKITSLPTQQRKTPQEAVADSKTKAPVLVVLKTSVGIVLPRGGQLWDQQIVWEPDADDVRRAEKAISAFMRTNAPSLADRAAD